MLFNIHVLRIAGAILDIGTRGQMIAGIKFFERLRGQFSALLETTEGEPLAFRVEAVGYGQKAAGGEGCALLIVTALQQIIPGEFLVSAVVVDDGDSALAADVVIIADGVVL